MIGAKGKLDADERRYVIIGKYIIDIENKVPIYWELRTDGKFTILSADCDIPYRIFGFAIEN